MGFIEDVERLRAERDDFFADHYASPLPEDRSASFSGLDYFPPDESWVVRAEFTPTNGARVDVPTSTGHTHAYTQLGSATVTIDGSPYVLAVLDDGDGNAFIPFTDETNGLETYRGGRYVTVTVRDDGDALIDFNAARNPYCAYDEDFTCPLPPPSNRIAAAVRAGERAFVRS